MRKLLLICRGVVLTYRAVGACMVLLKKFGECTQKIQIAEGSRDCETVLECGFRNSIYLRTNASTPIVCCLRQTNDCPKQGNQVSSEHPAFVAQRNRHASVHVQTHTQKRNPSLRSGKHLCQSRHSQTDTIGGGRGCVGTRICMWGAKPVNNTEVTFLTPVFQSR